MVRRRVKSMIGAALVFSLAVSGVGVPQENQMARADGNALTREQLETALAEKTGGEEKAVVDNSAVSVHDPSVVKNETKKEGQGNYYVFGSHMGVAKSDDLSRWTQVSTGENDEKSTLFGVEKDGKTETVSFKEAFQKNAYTGKVKVKYAGSTSEAEVDFGSFDASAWNTARDGYTVAGNMWAPDVIYNTTTKEYDMYLSLNGSKWNSVIILLTAKDIEGPYVYQGPVVYTGFSNTVDALSYKNTDLELVYGNLAKLPEKYDKADDGTWGEFYPHAIDPAVFYDKDGNLRMVYGSWSGGIYELELDEKTGLRDYTVQYAEKTGEKNPRDIVSDPYFGVHIAGGYYVSGEGPYMEYMDGKYYLFMSYGEYAPSGNYQMRIFSSEHPEGPFVDSNGVSAIYDEFQVNFNSDYGDCYDGSDYGAKGSTRGSRLMDNYKWDTMAKAEISQGHNSAITVDGKSFVVYHTKYDDGTLMHNLRVHELYTVDGCLVAAPYQYDASVTDKKEYTMDDVSGNYDVIFQKYDTNQHWTGGPNAEHGGNGSLANPGSMEAETPECFQFSTDGKVSFDGKEIGTWIIDSNKKNVTITITDAYGDAHLTGTYHGLLLEQNADGAVKTCFTGINAKTGTGIWGSFNGNSDIRAIALTEKNLKTEIPAKVYDSLTLPVKGLSGAKISWSSSNEAVLKSDGTLGKVTENTPVVLTERISKGAYYFEKTYDVTVSVMELTKEKVDVDLTSGTSAATLDNPFYGRETLDTVYIKYTVNWAEGAYKTGYDGLLSFFDSTGKGRVSLQSGPYLCYNDLNGSWCDVKYGVFDKKPADPDGAAAASFGKDYTYEVILTKEGVKMTENGTVLSASVTGENYTYEKILEYIREKCDKFSWGTTVDVNSFWATEKCTLKDVMIRDQVPAFIKLEDSYTIGSDKEPVVMENPFFGDTVDVLEIDYKVDFSGNVDAYGGLFSFYKKEGNDTGRITQQAMPYLCYNELTGNWIDVKTPSDYIASGTEHHVRYMITKDELYLNVDGESVTKLNVAGSGATYADLLKYVSACEKFSIGVNAETSFWGSVGSAVLKDVQISVLAKDHKFTEDKEGEETHEIKEKLGTTAKKGTAVSKAESYLASFRKDQDVKGSEALPLLLKAAKTAKTSVTLSWKKVSGAKGYLVYGAVAGKNGFKRLGKVSGASYKQKSLKKGTYYKYLVVAFDKNEKVLSTSATIFAVTSGGNDTNAKAVTTKAKKNKVSLEKGKTFALKGKAIPAEKKLKTKNYCALRYVSTKDSVASVTKKGVIKGKKKGTAVVYVYAQNGVAGKVKVTVK